jgi:hypothetical protein
MTSDQITTALTMALAVVALFYLLTKTLIAVLVYVEGYRCREVVDRSDPVVRAQADAYSANAERAMRNYLSDLAEKNPGQNLQGEKRMAAERLGQKTARFEARLIAEQCAARRQFRIGLYSVAASLFSRP